ncbi:hypothetical protein K456DRAFT_43150 [Colletotrichum gloeosporioides 23]|nr:hypothetical protein K456DRAFT_43150 [Colletotrichum gloeosporioides 23]
MCRSISGKRHLPALIDDRESKKPTKGSRVRQDPFKIRPRPKSLGIATNPVRTWLRWGTLRSSGPGMPLGRGTSTTSQCRGTLTDRPSRPTYSAHTRRARWRLRFSGTATQNLQAFPITGRTSCMRRQVHLNHHTPLKQKRRDDLQKAMPAYFSCLPAPESNNMKPPSHDDDNSHALPLQITNRCHVHSTQHQGPQAPQHPNTLQTSPSIPRADDQSWTNPTGPSNASPQAPSPTIPPPGAPITTAF